MTKDKRVEVLFEPSEYRRLEEHAHREGVSIGHVVREAVAKYVTTPTREERMAAMERFLALPPVDVGSPEELKAELIKDMDEYLERKLNPEAD